MQYDFDKVIDRGPNSGSYSSKWQGFGASFPGYDVTGALPLWVADGDFPCPAEVVKAVEARAAHGIFGYTSQASVESFFAAAVEWYQRRHHWRIDPAHLLFVPGIVPAICTAVQAYTAPGDGVIVQPPVYYPFMNSIRNNGRTVVDNPLVRDGDRYEMDLAHLERAAREPGNTMMILCSPHNPVARVWRAEELAAVARICAENGVLLFSDEIHADLTFGEHRFIPMAAVADEETRLVCAVAPSKTFNIAGLQAGLAVVRDAALREKLERQIIANRLPQSNIFGPIAGAAAFTHGDDYVDQLKTYLQGSIEFASGYVKDNLAPARMLPVEGTYLPWLDFTALGVDDDALARLVLEKAQVALDLGTWFGQGGGGHMRMNIACPRSTLAEALERLRGAIDGAMRGM